MTMLALVDGLEPLLAARIPRDPAVYIFVLLTAVSVHSLIWGLVRDYTDVEMWKSGIMAALSGAPLILILLMGDQHGWWGLGLAIAVIIGVSWWAFGLIYDLEATWRRGVLAVATPVIVAVMFPIAVVLRNLLLSALQS